MNIGENIRNLRKQKRLTQKEFAKDINMSQQAITSWEVGRTSPPPEMLNQIAGYFNVTTDFLINGEKKTPISQNRLRGVKIPVVGMSAAGLPITVEQCYIDPCDDDTWEEITTDMANSGTHVAVRIKGDSMEPRIEDGDIVIVRVQDTIEDGDTAIVIINGDEATCKRIKKQKSGLMLIANNPDYEPMYYSAQQIQELPVRIFGKVVELRGKF